MFEIISRANIFCKEVLDLFDKIWQTNLNISGQSLIKLFLIFSNCFSSFNKIFLHI